MENKVEEKITPISNEDFSQLLVRYGVSKDFKYKESVSGIGNDAAAISENGKYRLIANILFLQGINFDLTYMPFKHLGYKTVIAAVSDIYAMNGKPEHLSVSLGLSQKIVTEKLDELLEGITFACSVYEIDLIDIRFMPSLTGLTISAALLGSVEESLLVSRNNGKPSDLICVSGDLGSSLMGLHLLEREKRVLQGNETTEPDFGTNNDYVLERQIRPEAKKHVLDFLKDRELLPTAMINVKNGLAPALYEICNASNTGCRIHEQKIPLHQNTLKVACEMNYNPLIAALNGGDDYELLFTLPISEHEKIIDKLPKNISLIGYLTEKKMLCKMITRDGGEIDFGV